MAGLYDKQVEDYLNARPRYPKEWFKWLSDLTPGHSLAWDVGTGNGQAAISVAEHYDQVIATDVSQPQLQHAIPHPRIKYLHTPHTLSSHELATLVGTEGSFDLITVATAVHWFDLPSFYSTATHLLKKPGGIIAVWCYYYIVVSPMFDAVFKPIFDSAHPYSDPKVKYASDGYKSLPFPFEGVGLGCEGEPLSLEIPKELSFKGFVRMVRSGSAMTMAKEKGVDLLSDEVVKELERAWGGSELVRPVVYKAFMLVGKVRM